MVDRIVYVSRKMPGSPVDVYEAYVRHCWRANNTILEEGDDLLVGNTRRLGGVVIERITDAQPGMYLEYTVDSFKSFLKSYKSRVEFIQEDGGITKVRWRSEFQASNECVASMIAHTLGFVFTRMLQDLRKKLENGETAVVAEV